MICSIYLPTTNTGSARLGSEKTNVVSGSEFAQGQEDAVDNSKSTNLGLELSVLASHDVTNKTLDGDSQHQCVLGAKPIADKGTKNSTRKVEHVDDGVPAKRLGKGGRGASQMVDNRRRVDSEGIGRKLRAKTSVIRGIKAVISITHIVEEPHNRYGKKSDPIVPENKRVWGFVSHRLLGELLGLLEAKTQNK